MFKYVPIFVNFVQLGPFLLTSFKSLTTMNNDCYVSLRGFFEFFYFFKMTTCQPSSVSRVKVNVLCLIWSLYLLFLFNLVSILFKIDKFCPYRRSDQIYFLY